jgi:hypothetical protein
MIEENFTELLYKARILGLEGQYKESWKIINYLISLKKRGRDLREISHLITITNNVYRLIEIKKKIMKLKINKKNLNSDKLYYLEIENLQLITELENILNKNEIKKYYNTIAILSK